MTSFKFNGTPVSIVVNPYVAPALSSLIHRITQQPVPLRRGGLFCVRPSRSASRPTAENSRATVHRETLAPSWHKFVGQSATRYRPHSHTL